MLTHEEIVENRKQIAALLLEAEEIAAFDLEWANDVREMCEMAEMAMKREETKP